MCVRALSVVELVAWRYVIQYHKTCLICLIPVLYHIYRVWKHKIHRVVSLQQSSWLSFIFYQTDKKVVLQKVINKKCSAIYIFFKPNKQWFGVVVRAAVWHAGDTGSILDRQGLYTFERIAQRFEYALAWILRVKTLIYLFTWRNMLVSQPCIFKDSPNNLFCSLIFYCLMPK
jgi:hypothetical protein